jgi:hypothetical protein
LIAIRKNANPVIDELLRQSHATFDQAEFVKTINRTLSLILDNAPAQMNSK